MYKIPVLLENYVLRYWMRHLDKRGLRKFCTIPVLLENYVLKLFSSSRDEVEDISNMYGKNEDAFDYESAPPRGWQANRKDFTDKPTYKKYHEFDNDDQPYAV